MKPASLKSVALPLLSAAVLALATGCAGVPENESVADGETTSADLTSSARIARVTANGEGCHQGNVESSISADGASVTVDFDAFHAALPQGSVMSIVDCSLRLTIDGASRYQYTLESFESDGTAAIDGAPQAVKQTVSYTFMGSGIPHQEQTLDLLTAGSDGDNFALARQNDAAHAVWSPCSAVRDLEVTTRLWLQNNEERSADVRATASSMKLGVRFRKCR